MLKYSRGDVMNILICDDNTAFAMQLQKDINEYFHNPNMITNMITDHFDQIEGTYDVIFMDIELNDKNGIEIAKYHKNKHNCLVIFTSSHENLVFNTFQVEPFQFIRKNHYDYDKNIVFKQLKEKLLTLYITITLKDSKRSLQIPIQDIYSVVSIGHDLVVHTPKEDYMTTGTLKDFCNDYINTTLVQIQKNMIINLQYVEDYNRNIILYNNENLSVGRIYKNNFLHHYKEYKKL